MVEAGVPILVDRSGDLGPSFFHIGTLADKLQIPRIGPLQGRPLLQAQRFTGHWKIAIMNQRQPFGTGFE